MNKFRTLHSVSLLLFAGLLTFLYAQQSLWVDSNPYQDKIERGKIIQILVDEQFKIIIKDKHTLNEKYRISFQPDRTKLKFTEPFSQSKNKGQKNSVDDSFTKKIKFTLTGKIESEQNNLYKVVANRTVVYNNRPVTVRLSGFIDKKSIDKGRVFSTQLANLNLQISSIKGKGTDDIDVKKLAGTSDDEDITPSNTKISQSVQMKYFKKYINELMEIINEK